MARPLRIQYPGAVYHVTNRGNGRRNIVRDDVDRKRFLRTLGETVHRFGWILPAYVLMSNHFHLIVQLTDETLSSGMHWLDGRYSQSFNRRHGRVGHLFQGRFKAILVDSETYHLDVLRYVVLNPVRANISSHPKEYGWSSYQATAGIAEAPQWLAVDNVLALFGDDRLTAQARYAQFVQDAIGVTRAPWGDLVGQIYLGGENFIQDVREKVRLRPRSVEHPREQREVGNLSMDDVAAVVARVFAVDAFWIARGRGGASRMAAAWIARQVGKLKLDAIAVGLGIGSTGHTAGLIRRCTEALERDEQLRANVTMAVEELHALWKNREREA